MGDGISKELRDQLPDELAAEFKWRAAAGCYVATELTADKLERQVEAGRPSHDGGRTVSECGGGSPAAVLRRAAV
jgi:hypothetical protein